ncbi:MAG: imidazole glycerol phosphate synthase subunit HisH [Clostridia bacterium]|nr:imidazole glycerol phosphate synthase subunit HisH [Clostridia bacterium]
MKTVIIDYGMGNLHSVKNAFEFIGQQVVISSDFKDFDKADALILPGVGAFPDASKVLYESGAAEKIIELCTVKNKPLLGICLGMQLLLDESDEVKLSKGLGLIHGRCERIADTGLKIPHMGWNDLVVDDDSCPLLADTRTGDYVYFVHSFKANLADKSNLCAHTFYGEDIPAVIGNGKNVFGAQFHPEKSEKVGLGMLKSFAEFVKQR